MLNATTFTRDMLDVKQDSGYSVYKKGTTQPVTGLFETYYDDNRTLKEIIPISNGRINGTYQSFYKSGELEQTIDYLNSKRNGKQISYFKNNKKAYEADMKNEKQNGHVKAWYENNQLKYDVLFKDGKVDGVVTIYTKDGKIESIEKYKNGKSVKQIQPKTPNNVQLQTRALITYGTGKDIYYLFMSPLCPHCREFFSKIDNYTKDVTFYIYVVPLNPKNKVERQTIELIYREPYAKEKLKRLIEAENGSLDLNKTLTYKDTYVNNTEILKAQQIQAEMGVRGVPTLIDTKGFKYNANEFFKKYPTTK